MSTTTQTVSIQSTPTGAPRTYAFSILIDGAALNDDHNVFEINWDFGDGSTVTAFNPEHQYSGTGNYSVSADVVYNGPPKGDGDDASSSGDDDPPPTQSALTTIFVQ